MLKDYLPKKTGEIILSAALAASGAGLQTATPQDAYANGNSEPSRAASVSVSRKDKQKKDKKPKAPETKKKPKKKKLKASKKLQASKKKKSKKSKAKKCRGKFKFKFDKKDKHKDTLWDLYQGKNMKQYGVSFANFLGQFKQDTGIKDFNKIPDGTKFVYDCKPSKKSKRSKRRDRGKRKAGDGGLEKGLLGGAAIEIVEGQAVPMLSVGYQTDKLGNLRVSLSGSSRGKDGLSLVDPKSSYAQTAPGGTGIYKTMSTYDSINSKIGDIINLDVSYQISRLPVRFITGLGLQEIEDEISRRETIRTMLGGATLATDQRTSPAYDSTRKLQLRLGLEKDLGDLHPVLKNTSLRYVAGITLTGGETNAYGQQYGDHKGMTHSVAVMQRFNLLGGKKFKQPYRQGKVYGSKKAPSKKK